MDGTTVAAATAAAAAVTKYPSVRVAWRVLD